MGGAHMGNEEGTNYSAIAAVKTPGAIVIDPNGFYTTERLAEVLGETPDTIRTRRHRGIGPAYSRPSGRLNGRAYYRGSDVVDWLSRNAAASTLEESARSDAAGAPR
jgi:Helix-turn-helix domain